MQLTKTGSMPNRIGLVFSSTHGIHAYGVGPAGIRVDGLVEDYEGVAHNVGGMAL